MGEKCAVGPAHDCLGAERVEELKRALDTYREQSSETHKEIFARLNKLERENAVMDERYNTILEKLDRLTEKVDALEAKPAKRWDGVVEKIILTAMGALVLFMLAKMGLA